MMNFIGRLDAKNTTIRVTNENVVGGFQVNVTFDGVTNSTLTRRDVEDLIELLKKSISCENFYD